MPSRPLGREPQAADGDCEHHDDLTEKKFGGGHDDLRTPRRDIPATMQGFSQLAQAATKHEALDKKTKELIALAIGVATRCDGCIGFHTEALVKLGATRAEVEETLGMAVYMGGGPSLMYAADAIGAFEQFNDISAVSAAQVAD